MLIFQVFQVNLPDTCIPLRSWHKLAPSIFRIKIMFFIPSLSILLLLMLTTTAHARDDAQAAGEKLVEDWARVMYCQAAYRNTENKGRIYEHDIKQCDAAEAWVMSQVNRYNEQGQASLRTAARQRNSTITYSTRDIGAVVKACRESCDKIAAKSEPE